MIKRFIFAAGLCVVLLQLSLLSVDFPVGTFTYGAVTERFEKVAVALSHYTERAARALNISPQYQSIVFVGDVLLARNVEYLMQKNGASYPFEGLALHSLGAHPAIVGNFESSMRDPHETTPAYHMRFSVDAALLQGLSTARFTHLSLANNHSFDFGEDAYTNAQNHLTENGFAVFGHGKEVNEHSISYIETRNGTVALIGIHASEREPDYEVLRELLKDASEKSVLQVAYIHWGTEYILVHSRAQERIATQLVDLGIDLIVGHHPHVVQDVDLIDGVVVFYSLGNYVFDQYFSKDVKEGLVLTLDMDENPVVNIIPVTSESSLSQPHMMDPTSHQQFLEALAKRSDPSLREAVIAGVIPLKSVVATSTEMAIMVR